MRPFKFPLQICKDMVLNIGKYRYRISLDMESGYWKIPSHKLSRGKLAFLGWTRNWCGPKCLRERKIQLLHLQSLWQWFGSMSEGVIYKVNPCVARWHWTYGHIHILLKSMQKVDNGIPIRSQSNCRESGVLMTTGNIGTSPSSIILREVWAKPIMLIII